ncbi:MAG: ABC transporter substrate-binding protein [Acidimicrobiia bacterium]|nr:ABC transporter substrate-binding protein [Acidimicrobiia bacterium]
MNENREREFIERNAKSNPDIARRRLLEWMLKAGWTLPAASVLSASAITACGQGGLDADSGFLAGRQDQAGGAFGEGGDEIKIAAIGPYSGIGSFVGAILQRSLDASVAHINATGGVGGEGRKVRVIQKDISAADVQQVINAYQDIAGAGDFAGIVFGVPGGVVELQDRIAADQLLIAAAFLDLKTPGELYPQNQALRPVFQFLLPTDWSIDLMADYCANDRGFSRVALMYDNTSESGIEDWVRSGVTKAGLSLSSVTTYTLNNSNFGPQLSKLGDAQSFWIWGLATDVANAVKQIDDAGRAYITIDEAKAGTNPQPMGSPAALGEKKWAELAGESAKAGTLTAWHIGGLIYLPQFAIRGWMQEFLDTFPSGGEETPANALAMITNAVAKAGNIQDREGLITAVETMGPVTFAAMPFEFSADNHLAIHPDDMIMVTLERAGKPARAGYEVGREWTDVFPTGYVGPTHLVRPTIEANTRRYPDVMKTVMEEGWGTHCPAGDPTH